VNARCELRKSRDASLFWTISEAEGLENMTRIVGGKAESYRPVKQTSQNHHLSARALHRINELLEEQSKRIAHAVHDEAGQMLAAVFVRLDEAARESPDGCNACFQEIKQMLETIEVQLRGISHDLRPTVLDDLGLAPAVECLLNRFAKRTGIAVSLDSTINARMGDRVELTLYRIVQESLTNIARHSQATEVEVRFRMENQQVICSIQDNGVGFVLNDVMARKGNRGLGLIGIRERVESIAGSLWIGSMPGQGTKLVITVPVGV
jgi:signal transduction histidine kinase